MRSITQPTRIDWGHVLEEAAAIVDEYDTLVTLRQCFYRLVAAQLLPNNINSYKGLSDRTAKARRAGTFPELTDLTRRIERASHWKTPGAALSSLASQYRRDRTAGQDISVYIGVEKKGLVAQLDSWFGGLGIPILALGGYASQSFVNEVMLDADAQDRKAVLLYAGDFDPSGEDIDRDFVERTMVFDDVVRVALTAAQVADYNLPPAMGKSTDSRASQFVQRHGQLVQVELDALAPPDLRALYQEAIDRYWDTSMYQEILGGEARERDLLVRLARTDTSVIESWLSA
ncbi:MAG: hypothetical protein ACRDYV_00130 [Acidimicrobiia bacterium]